MMDSPKTFTLKRLIGSPEILSVSPDMATNELMPSSHLLLIFDLKTSGKLCCATNRKFFPFSSCLINNHPKSD